MTTLIRLIVVILALVSFAARAGAQDRLEQVHELYASADYHAALDALSEVREVSGKLTVDGDRYLALCLLALGRTDEADQVIERIITAHPDFDPGRDASPRVRRAFRAVFIRVLPPLARQLYDDGKAAFDRKEFAEALQIFERALPLITTLAMDGQPGMADRRILANDFLTLSRRLVPPPVVEPPPLVSRALDLATFVTPAIDPNEPITQPVVIRQTLPEWPNGIGHVATEFHGTVDILIDDRGTVTEAKLVDSVHPLYDARLLEAARDWLYEPARRGGRVIATRKRVAITLRNR
jgi:tetratricopeptide (TPR) repeat protein